ncbi:hypothetical protein Heshes_02110 [Alicyclobacillus hesperidum]|uniref:Uncharacterized protein n=1 Tax=Alicyclobacillus hesperidum TaxID=89784 RepID=A0A1H2SS59_9BACL|nr:hypothetical protein [Alicyclobacillus hesperidum]GLV12527.1 hypothetical protein Heshes_02110 [Alicyclobacillus hesperidum]SDW34452.1 hypothetical protein SAMN04489725_104213 [Alicyclobacillus hesperidum]
MTSRRRLGRLFLGVAGLATMIEVAFFHHLNHLLNSQQVATERAIQRLVQVRSTQVLANLKQHYQGVTESPNGQYATYVDTATNGTDVVHVVSLETGKQVSEATDLYPVQYVDWLGNTEVFVGEQRSPGDLELNTFYVSNGQQADVTAASVPVFSGLSPDAQITKVTYSTQTNDIFVLITSNGSSEIYHVGTMEDVQSVPVPAGYVKNIAMTQTGKILYVEINQNGVWNVLKLSETSATSSYTPDFEMNAQLVKANAALISVIGDTLYYGNVNSNGLVTSVYKQSQGTPQLVKQLTRPILASRISVTGTGDLVLNPSAATNASV